MRWPLPRRSGIQWHQSEAGKVRDAVLGYSPSSGRWVLQKPGAVGAGAAHFRCQEPCPRACHSCTQAHGVQPGGAGGGRRGVVASPAQGPGVADQEHSVTSSRRAPSNLSLAGDSSWRATKLTVFTRWPCPAHRGYWLNLGSSALFTSALCALWFMFIFLYLNVYEALRRWLWGKESLLPMQEMQIQSLDREDSQTRSGNYSSIHAWREIPWDRPWRHCTVAKRA